MNIQKNVFIYQALTQYKKNKFKNKNYKNI